jgi:hypothetical protein
VNWFLECEPTPKPLGVGSPTRLGSTAGEHAGGRRVSHHTIFLHLRHPGQAGQSLHQIVVDHHHGKKYEKYESGLIDALFDGQADFFLH